MLAVLDKEGFQALECTLAPREADAVDGEIVDETRVEMVLGVAGARLRYTRCGLLGNPELGAEGADELGEHRLVAQVAGDLRETGEELLAGPVPCAPGLRGRARNGSACRPPPSAIVLSGSRRRHRRDLGARAGGLPEDLRWRPDQPRRGSALDCGSDRCCSSSCCTTELAGQAGLEPVFASATRFRNGRTKLGAVDSTPAPPALKCARDLHPCRSESHEFSFSQHQSAEIWEQARNPSGNFPGKLGIGLTFPAVRESASFR